MHDNKVAIPVEKHVRQYLLNNSYIKKPFRLSMGESFGVFLYQFLKPKQFNVPLRYHPENVIEVHLANSYNWHWRMWIPPVNAKAFNSLMEKRMKEEFDLYMASVIKHVPNAKVDRLIRDFEDKYQLHETKLNFQTLKRRFYRGQETSTTVAAVN